MADPGRIPFKLDLTMCERTINAHINVPETSMRVTDLLPILHAFDEAVVGMAADKAQSDGQKISCRAGCGACCRQLAPVAESEAVYLADLVATMPPDRRQAVRERFCNAIAKIGEPLLERMRDTRALDTMEKRRQLGIEYFALGIPCPFLEDESCSIHQTRPMTCREYLVTSPPENCRTPGPETIRQVPVPIKLSQILYCFGDGKGNEATRWVPLILSLEWAESGRRREVDLQFPGPELFKNFASQIR